MSTVTINGEQFEYDFSSKKMADAIALEVGTGIRYADFEEELGAGSAKAMAALIWDIWRRNGKQVNFASMLDGTVDVDLLEFAKSMLAAQDQEPGDARANPASGRRGVKAGTVSTR